MNTCPNIQPPCGEGCMKAGYAYVPRQIVNRFYDYESALRCGTMFPELVMPRGKYGPNEIFPGSQRR